MAKTRTEMAELNLTPMIDVVFQLIIFFIVTVKMNEEINEDIILETAPHGPVVATQDSDPRTLTIEVDRRGRISIHNVAMSHGQLRRILVGRWNRHGGSFPVMIRADYRTQHQHVRAVMDIASSIGIWRINFVAVQEHKYTAGRHKGPKHLYQ